MPACQKQPLCDASLSQEKDKLLVVTAALLAERRLQRGLKLNHPEAVAFLSLQILEGARDGEPWRNSCNGQHLAQP